MFSASYLGYYVLAGVLSLVGMLVSQRLKAKFHQYSQIGTRSGMSGAEIAAAMLRQSNISDVKIVEGHGFLTDH
ncbi:MAG: zinc metallopeptidase, partial [Saprospiraceae bacterium]|nr:zinc metallopeptidase [Saprospiraceae bacterium]